MRLEAVLADTTDPAPAQAAAEALRAWGLEEAAVPAVAVAAAAVAVAVEDK